MILEELRTIIADQTGLSPDEIKPESNIIKDLGCDSLDIVEMLMTVEEKYNITVDDSEVSDMATIADVVRFIEAKVA